MISVIPMISIHLYLFYEHDYNTSVVVLVNEKYSGEQSLKQMTN